MEDRVTGTLKPSKSSMLLDETVRDPMADIEAVRAVRSRPMAERLELALSWNLVACELRAGLEEQTGRSD